MRLGAFHSVKVVGGMVLLLFSYEASGFQSGKVETDRAGETPKLVVQLGHSQPVNSVAFSRDGKYIVTGGKEPSVILWEAGSGIEIRRFPVAGAVTTSIPAISHMRGAVEITSLSFSPDGKRILAGANDKVARLWDSETGAEVWNVQEKSGGTGSVAFSPNGRSVVTGGRFKSEFPNIPPDGGEINSIGILNAQTGKEELRFRANSNPTMAVRFVNEKPQILAAEGNHFFTREASTERKEQWLDERKMSLEQMDRLLPKTIYLPEEDSITAGEISGDGKKIAVGTLKGTVWLLNNGKGDSLQRFVGHISQITSIAFSQNNELMATASWDKIIRVWEVESGKELQRFAGHLAAVNSVQFAPDGKSILSGGEDATVRLWDISTGRELRRFGGFAISKILRAAVSPDGQYVLTGAGSIAQLWDMSTGRIENSFPGDASLVTAISLDGSRVLTSSAKESTMKFWDMTTGAEISRFEGHSSGVVSAALSSDGKLVVSGGLDSTVRLWDAASGKEKNRFAFRNPFAAAFSPDNKYVAAGGYGGLTLWNVSNGIEEKTFNGAIGIFSVAFSPDGKQIVTGNPDGRAKLWDVATGRELEAFSGTFVSFGRDGKRILTGSLTNEVILWDVATGSQISTLSGVMGFFSPDNQYVDTWGKDHSMHIWSALTGTEVCSLTSLGDGDWLVVTPDGRFDTNDIEKVKGMFWILPNEPMRLLPLEIFMRDYYEPRLLPRILNGEQFKPIRKLSQLNLVQPEIKVAGVERQRDKPDMVTITVEVSKATGEFKQGNRAIKRETGVYDLRLFRDGQIVGQFPREAEAASNPATAILTAAQELGEWQKHNRVELDAGGKRLIKFANIRLPRNANVKQVEFSAYVFNEDRVKSRTDRTTFSIPADLVPRKGRAYIISVGVNAYENPAFDLKYSVNDANAIQKAMLERLSRTGDYSDIVEVPLTSDAKRVGGKRELIENTATKTNFKAVLDLLAGRPVDAETRKKIPNVDNLRQATPEDLVLISFSSHGYADNDGNFYFILADTGKSEGEPVSEKLVKELRPHFLSSEELSISLRDVDAGEMLMIVDACHSAAAVQGNEFKPGPMGSRGLGQLSYDKGMRILTATQATDVAYGSGTLKQGLLTYVLVKDGLEDGKADYKPVDRKITVSEWLQYGEQGVPKLLAEAGKRAGQADAPVELRDLVQKTLSDIKTQRPSLFDFSRKRRDSILEVIRNK